MRRPDSSTVGELLEWARLCLAPRDTGAREAALLLARVVGRNEAWVRAHDEVVLDEVGVQRFREVVSRRLHGEPFAYLFEEREFWGRSFFVDSRVLVPRPETEHLVEEALSLDLPPRARVLDVGTGSGCIAITLALERPQWAVVASDHSIGALAVARRNRDRLGARDRVLLLASDLLSALSKGSHGFDIVVCNPPYVDPRERESLAPEVARYEPASALFPPGETLDCYRWLLHGRRQAEGLPASPRLATHQLVVLEVGAGQAPGVTGLAERGGRKVLRVTEDLAGHQRVVVLG